MSKRFVAEGAKVAITGRNQKKLENAVKELGTSAIAIQGDVSNLNDLERIYKEVENQFGKIDTLVVNAGVYIIAPLADFTEEMFEKVSNINFKGAFFSVQKALPVLNDGASIILISSTVNGKGVPNHAAYSATKAAVRSLARSFSADLLELLINPNHRSHQVIAKNLQDITPSPTTVPFVRKALETNFDYLEYTCSDSNAIAKWFSWLLYSIGTDEAINVMKEYSNSTDEGIANEMRYRLNKIQQ